MMEGYENVAATGIEFQQSSEQRATSSSPVAFYSTAICGFHLSILA